VCVANKIYFVGIPKVLPYPIAEVAFVRDVLAECACSEASRVKCGDRDHSSSSRQVLDR
jgi:hypothetical protein